ncbi:MAG: threonylcarbamoyl-AMP synthase [Chloroflexi bacterium]|nr:threonylcarbamoyl-AMP synthase [Chloroflexota bacterium]
MWWWPTDVLRSGDAVRHAGELIREGKLVVFPTDTVYGLGTNPFNPDAIERLFKAKGRPPEKAIAWLVSHVEHAKRHCRFDALAERLAERYWPGPLTLVLPLLRPVPGGLPSQAVRIPNHACALAVIQAAGGAVATTSANRSSFPAARTAHEAARALGDRVDLIIDAGTAPGGVDSTVLDLTTSPPTVLRPGPLDPEDLEETIGLRLV